MRWGRVCRGLLVCALGCGYRADPRDAGPDELPDGPGSSHVPDGGDAAQPLCVRDATWESEPVLSGAELRIAAMAVQPDGTVHAILDDYLENLLLYATNAGGAWVTEPVDRTPGYDAALTLDGDDRPHVLYAGADDSLLHHAQRDPEGWRFEAVLTAPACALPSVAAEDDGTVHVVYSEGTGYGDPRIRYATNRGGAWTSETLSTGPYSFGPTSMAIDADAVPHALLFVPPTINDFYDLRHVSRSGAWVSEAVDRGVESPLSPALAIGSDGTIHECHPGARRVGEVYEFQILHGTNASGRWELEPVDHDEQPHYVCNVGVDERGAVHIAYDHRQSEPEAAFRYATNEGGAWKVETIAEGAGVGDGRLGLDAEGIAHALYGSFTYEDEVVTGHIHHAWRVAGECQ